MADDVTDPDAPADDAVVDGADAPVAGDAPATDDTDPDAEAAAPAGAKVVKKAKGKATDAAPARPEVRKKVVSKRVTPKGAEQGAKASTAPRSKGGAPEGGYSARYTPPAATYAKGPSPWWVPALMFALLIVGALVIMLNYMGVFGDAANIRLVIGLGLILGGIITATQYR